MDDLREKIEHALDAIYGHPNTSSLAADFVMQVLREQEPVAKIHYDGYWTHAPGKDPLDRYSSKSQMEVYAAPKPPSEPFPSRKELVDFAVEDQFLLYCDEDEFVEIARAVLHRFAAAPKPEDSKP